MTDRMMPEEGLPNRSARRDALQESLMDNLPCGAGIYEFKDGQMSLTYQNQVYWELVGLNEEAYPDCSEMSAIHPDDLPIVMQELSAAIEQHRDLTCDIRLRHLTRGYRPVQLSGHIVFKESGSFLIYATFAPISDVVIEARQQQARLALLTNSIPGGIAVYEGKPDALDAIQLTYFSDGVCRLFGYTREEYEKLAEVNPLGLVTSDDKAHMFESIIALVRDGIQMDYIYRVKVKGGETRWINVRAVMGEPNGDRLTVNAVFLAMDSDEAERLAEARAHTEELSTELHAARKSDLAKSRFLSFTSHEIRTPLNAVMGYISIAQNEIKRAKSDEERRQTNVKVLEYLEKSQIASRHLLMIINDVLDMSAIESGKLKVDHSPFDLRHLIANLTVMFSSQAKEKGVDFNVRTDQLTEEWFIGDSLRMNQVLANLLSNAVKFTAEGGNVTLTITEQIVDNCSTGFCFTVTDTGIGMTQEYLSHIWTPFEQAEATISRRFGGSGLGLSITKNLVDLMGGTIEVESELGVGSKFMLNLAFQRIEQPEKRTEAGLSTVNAPATDGSDTFRYDFGGAEVLLVEDNDLNMEVAKCILTSANLAVDSAWNGQEALDHFTTSQPGTYMAILMDVHMPVMDGYQATRMIRASGHPDAQTIPIIAMTADAFTEDIAETYKAGMSHHVSKPIDEETLFASLSGYQNKKL